MWGNSELQKFLYRDNNVRFSNALVGKFGKILVDKKGHCAVGYRPDEGATNYRNERIENTLKSLFIDRIGKFVNSF